MMPTFSEATLQQKTDAINRATFVSGCADPQLEFSRSGTYGLMMRKIDGVWVTRPITSMEELATLVKPNVQLASARTLSEHLAHDPLHGGGKNSISGVQMQPL